MIMGVAHLEQPQPHDLERMNGRAPGIGLIVWFSGLVACDQGGHGGAQWAEPP